jgi:hypothetical protein
VYAMPAPLVLSHPTRAYQSARKSSGIVCILYKMCSKTKDERSVAKSNFMPADFRTEQQNK